MKTNYKSSNIRLISTVLAILLALPLPWYGFAGLYTWFSPFIMLNSVFVLKGFVLLNLLAIIILVISFIRKRFFCIYLCPAGYGCDLISKHGFWKASGHRHIPDLSKYLAIISLASAIVGLPLFIMLDPLAIFTGFFTTFSGGMSAIEIFALSGLPVLLLINIVLPGIWCAKICPLGGLQNITGDIKHFVLKYFFRKERVTENYSQGRRYFLATGAGLTAGLLIPKQLNHSKEPYFRPPASVRNDKFNTLCIRCGNCIKSCPTGIIVHRINNNDLLSFMTPEVQFESGYCLEDCNLCSRVCPTGSITLFSTEAKSQIIMGKAEIILHNCLLLHNTECNKCKVSCRYEAITIKPEGDLPQAVPVLELERCVGCGACAVICPPRTISMIPVII
jgi:ferredoxin-type protein NapF